MRAKDRQRDLKSHEIFDIRKPKATVDEIEGVSTQAGRVIAKFGGANKLAKAIERLRNVVRKGRRNSSSVYRWLYPVEKGGTGGRIPNKSLAIVIAVARYEGVLLTAQDLDPRTFKNKAPE